MTNVLLTAPSWPTIFSSCLPILKTSSSRFILLKIANDCAKRRKQKHNFHIAPRDSRHIMADWGLRESAKLCQRTRYYWVPALKQQASYSCWNFREKYSSERRYEAIFFAFLPFSPDSKPLLLSLQWHAKVKHARNSLRVIRVLARAATAPCGASREFANQSSSSLQSYFIPQSKTTISTLKSNSSTNRASRSPCTNTKIQCSLKDLKATISEAKA